MLYPSSALKTSIATSQNNFTKTKTKKTSFERKAFFCCGNIFRLNFKSILLAQNGQISVILVLRDFQFRFFTLVDYAHDNSVHDYVEHPAYRPAQIEHIGRIYGFARRVNPHDTENANAEKVGYHRRKRIAHSAHTSHDNFNYAAYEVDRQNDFHSVASILDDNGIGRVQPCDILPCREQNERPNQADYDYHNRGFDCGFF